VPNNTDQKEPYNVSVTEIAGIDASEEEIQRLCNRYYWAGKYCHSRSVLEISCGTAQGAGYLFEIAEPFWAGDYSWGNLIIARQHYGKRMTFIQFDAQLLPFADRSFDVVLLLESIYFIQSASKAVSECARILRKGGKLLITMPNRDMYDFSASKFAFDYYNMQELDSLLLSFGFSSEFFGDTPIGKLSWLQRVLRPIKAIAVKTHLVPQTRRGKKLLRRLVFGPLRLMPKEINQNTRPQILPTSIQKGTVDRIHKVIYCAATLQR
jgi:SAM-dependent methyltransferase